MIELNGKELVCFDIETTGADAGVDKIIQLHALKIFPKGSMEEKQWLVNPEIPIHPKATEVHGYTNEAVKDKPTFKQLAIQILQFIQDAGTIVTYNGNRFDIPILMREFSAVGIDWDPRSARLVDVFGLVQRMNPRTLSAMYKHYVGEELDNAHDAGSDVWATLKVLHHMSLAHPEIPSDPSDIELFANNDKPILDIGGFFTADENGYACFSTGKHAGEKVDSRLHGNYLEWMINKGNFAKDTKEYAIKFLNNK